MSIDEPEISDESFEESTAAPPPSVVGQPLTAMQAKVNAIAHLTMQAYDRAATLEITKEESEALQADFPDDAFLPGAGGKENLIYIEHVHLRERLNNVLGMGKWAIIPRSRWEEAFRNSKGSDGVRVFVEAMLVIRGCFVGEAVSSHDYYPSNPSQTYDDAVESAKTAAFRRCAKEFGVGLQAYKKSWCEGWWQRRGTARPSPAWTQTPRAPQRPAPAAPAPAPTPAPAPKQEPKAATDATRAWMIGALEKRGLLALAEEFAHKVADPAWLMPTETLKDLPLEYVPVSQEQLRLLEAAITDFGNGMEAKNPYPPNATASTPAKAKKADPKPKTETADSAEAAPVSDDDYNSPTARWRSYPVPFGKSAGVILDKLDKKVLFGFWANFEPQAQWTDKEGKVRDSSPDKLAREREFRAMLDSAGKHYNFSKSE